MSLLLFEIITHYSHPDIEANAFKINDEAVHSQFHYL